MQYIVQFSNGHTSPGLDDMQDVLHYIASQALESFWDAKHKKAPSIKIFRKKNSIRGDTVIGLTGTRKTVLANGDASEENIFVPAKVLLGFRADGTLVGKIPYASGNQRRRFDTSDWFTRRMAKKELQAAGALEFVSDDYHPDAFAHNPQG